MFVNSPSSEKRMNMEMLLSVPWLASLFLGRSSGTSQAFLLAIHSSGEIRAYGLRPLLAGS